MSSLKVYVMSGAAFMLPMMAGAQTGNFYAGVGVHSSYFDADDTIYDVTIAQEGVSDRFGRDSSEVSVGVHGGYRYQFDNNVFVAGELFYLNTEQDKSFDNGDRIEVGDQYGVNVKAGYEWRNGISAYGIAGLSYFDYDLLIEGDRASDSKVKSVIGGGVGYRFNPTLSSQFELTSLSDEVSIAGDSDRTIGSMNLRLALTYDF